MKSPGIIHQFIKVSVLLVCSALLGIGCGSSSPAGGSGGAGGNGGAGGAGPTDPARYNFENAMTQGWVSGSTTDMFTSVMTSTAQHFAGSSSLAAGITATAAALGSYSIEVIIAPAVMIAAGTPVTFHVYIPTDAPIDWFQPYIQEDLTFAFIGSYKATGTFTKGAWNTVDVAVPVTVVNPIYKVGVQVHNSDVYTGTIYIDSINW
jgi:hypothetical protein